MIEKGRKAPTQLGPREDRAKIQLPDLPKEVREAYLAAGTRSLLSARALLKKLPKSGPHQLRVLQLYERLATGTMMYEADLVDAVRYGTVRQLVLRQGSKGWELQALLTWRTEFLTLVSLKKEKRHYADLDRLIRTITRCGTLPPTILIGETK